MRAEIDSIRYPDDITQTKRTEVRREALFVPGVMRWLASAVRCRDAPSRAAVPQDHRLHRPCQARHAIERRHLALQAAEHPTPAADAESSATLAYRLTDTIQVDRRQSSTTIRATSGVQTWLPSDLLDGYLRILAARRQPAIPADHSWLG